MPDPSPAETPSTKVSLVEIFERAGLAPVQEGEVRLRSLRKELHCLRFAQLYVKHHFDPVKAYAEFNPRRRRMGRSLMASKWMQGPETGPRIAFHIRTIVQETTRRVQNQAVLDVQQLIAINQNLILADETELLEQVHDPQSGKILTRYKSLASLTPEQRMSIRSVRLKDGEIQQIQTYSRLDAQRAQLDLLELLAARGGNDQAWMSQFNRRMTEARERRIALEVAAGKVVRLPPTTGGAL